MLTASRKLKEALDIRHARGACHEGDVGEGGGTGRGHGGAGGVAGWG